MFEKIVNYRKTLNLSNKKPAEAGFSLLVSFQSHLLENKRLVNDLKVVIHAEAIVGLSALTYNLALSSNLDLQP